MERYAIQCVNASHQTDWWRPAEDLERLDERTVGPIEVLGAYEGYKNTDIAPKGHHSLAQGNALGLLLLPIPARKRATQLNELTGAVPPFQIL